MDKVGLESLHLVRGTAYWTGGEFWPANLCKKGTVFRLRGPKVSRESDMQMDNDRPLAVGLHRDRAAA